MPIVTLMVLAPVLTELVTGSTPVIGLLSPFSLILLFIGYSVPVVLIRDYVVRNRIGFAGTFAIGFAFGVYNEGLLAKTLIIAHNLPIKQFDQYGVIGGVNVPWMLTICLYHALAAVFLPILFTHARYPEAAARPWLGKKLAIGLAVGLVALASFSFMSSFVTRGTGGELVSLLAVMALCVILARRSHEHPFDEPAPGAAPTMKAFWLGISTLVAFFVLPPLAASHVSLLIYFAIVAAAAWFYVRLLHRSVPFTRDNVILFGLGFYVQSATFGGLLGLSIGSIDRVLTAVALDVALIWAARRVVRNAKTAPVAMTAPSGPAA
ncbi:MAG TPA: hypothetical protein VMT99_00305 [Candidatus Paceibacterota bacterium]|nr:hypothetical protein [Candidatus Paceibacterota bacterium]